MTVEELSERLGRLENQNRWMRRGGLAALLAIVAVVAMGQATSVDKVVQAQCFEVLDQSGVVQAQFGMSMSGRGSGSPGSPQLRIFNRDQKKAELQVTSGGISILSGEGHVDVQVQNFLKEGPGLIVCDGGGRTLLRIVRDSAGSSELWLADRNGKVLLEASAK